MIAQVAQTAVRGYSMLGKTISLLSVGIFIGAAIVEILDIRSKVKAMRRMSAEEKKEREAAALNAWVEPKTAHGMSEA
jgi:hypothetical protein